MLKEVIRLLKLSFCNFANLNVIRNTKDPKEKKHDISMMIAWGIIGIILEIFMFTTIYGYTYIGLVDIIPVYCFFLSSMLILIFSFFKVTSIIFQKNSYEMLISMPINKNSIVISRFLDMYIRNLLLSFMIMIPGMVIYSCYKSVNVLFFVYYLIGSIFLPMIPLTISTGIASAVKYISSKVKRKNIVEIILALSVFVLYFYVMYNMTGQDDMPSQLQADMIKNISNILSKTFRRIYYPAEWFQKAVLDYNILSLLLFIVVGLVIFVAVMALIGSKFVEICSSLNSVYSRNNYKKVVGNQSSILVSLIKKEFKYYFSVSSYVLNTIIGYVFAIAISVAFVVVGPEKLSSGMPIPNILQMLAPFFVALTIGLMPTTSSSFSLEGKTRWIAKTLPIPFKAQCDGKLLMYYLLASPFYIASVILTIVGLKLTVMQAVWTILVNFVYIIFMGIVGLTANILLPKFEWKNEVDVVKQGAPTIISMIVCIITLFIPLGINIKFGLEYQNVINSTVVVIVTLMDILLYRYAIQKEI